MPNKRKFSKLATKLLISGKLNKKESVQETLKYLAKKAEIDNEDIDFDFENVKNDFGKLEDGDDDTRKLKTKIRKPKKRPAEDSSLADKKEAKISKLSETVSNKSNPSSDIIPKKSKKNKYFFVAHPEEIKKKQDILKAEEGTKTKFVIDKEKIKLNKIKKLKAKKMESAAGNKNEIKNKKKSETVGKKGLKKGKNKIWVIENCSSSDEDESKEKFTDNESSEKALNIENIDKSFKLKKTIEKLKDGSVIEVFKPEYIEEDDASNDNDPDNSEEEGENEDESQQASEPSKDEKKDKGKKNGSTVKNMMTEKLLASRFRYLNEMLYTQPSSESFDYFKK